MQKSVLLLFLKKKKKRNCYTVSNKRQIEKIVARKIKLLDTGRKLKTRFKDFHSNN